MIVVDTSAWIALLRRSEGPIDRALARLIETRAEIAVTEAVVMELLAGARSAREERRLRALVLGFPVLPLGGLPDFEAAAQIFNTCHRAGETLRSIVDCLVAVPTMLAGATLLHADRDFETIARHSPLRLEPLSA